MPNDPARPRHNPMGAWLRTVALCSSLLACGGGSSAGSSLGGAGTPPPPTPLPTVDVSTVAVGDTSSALGAHWQSGAFMEIFVRAYKDSDGDGVGDLRGLTQSLDYLKDLGIRGIWLMPVTASQDHDHGYATTDYRNTETAYGTLADFDALLKAAHQRGIGVIIDHVINHSAALNPLFANSSAATTNPYRDWYIWQNPAPAGWSIFGHNPWYAGTGGAYLAQFSPTMPDFNFRNPAVLAYHQDNLRFWLNRGVDGFRFDAVTHLIENGATAWQNQPESLTLMGQLRGALTPYAQRFVVCEATVNPALWAEDRHCGSAFAFGHQNNIVNAARGQASAVQSVADFYRGASANMSTMVSNHDLFAGDRLWNQVNGDMAQYRLAAATYLLQSGTPFIYYGEELGMAAAGDLVGDARLRTPMSWTADARTAGFTTGSPFRAMSSNAGTHNVAAQQADANSIYHFYKSLLALRNTYPSLARGRYDAIAVVGSTLLLQRSLDAERTLVAINYGNSAAAAEASGLPPAAVLSALYPAGATAATADGQGQVQLPLAAQSVQVFRVN